MGDFIQDQKKIYDLYYLKDPEEYGNSVDFAFNQAEKFLESTIRNSHKIQEKSYNLITLSLALITVLMGFLYFVLKGEVSGDIKSSLLILSIISLVVIAIVIYGSLKASKVETIYYMGRSPDFTLDSESTNLSAYQIKVLAIMDYHHSIIENMKMTGRKSSNLEFSYNLFIYYIMLLVSVLIFSFILVALGVIDIG